MSTLYSFTPSEVFTRLFRPTVTGRAVGAGEDHAEEEVVPDRVNCQMTQTDEDRRRQRQQDAPIDLEEARAVDAGGLAPVRAGTLT